MRCGDDRRRGAEKLLKLFFGYERPEIADFRKAVEQFKTDLPAVLDALRDMIDASTTQATPASARPQTSSSTHAQETINPSARPKPTCARC